MQPKEVTKTLYGRRRFMPGERDRDFPQYLHWLHYAEGAAAG